VNSIKKIYQAEYTIPCYEPEKMGSGRTPLPAINLAG